ncbi:hypothetical protein L6Q96_21180 [Candidatus Binatia bacterium]|nr:hypothetical protein [Candidatus Binatia bacterium]
MLDLVTAARFDRRTSSGKTWPCLLSCATADGNEREVVAKFSAGCERGVALCANDGETFSLLAGLVAEGMCYLAPSAT